MGISRVVTRVFAVVVALGAGVAVSSPAQAGSGGGLSFREAAPPRLVASGLGGSTGSTVGPDGGVYVVDGAAGVVRRVDPRTGRTSTFASGLPKQVGSFGGAVDVAFMGRTAYVLVTLVSADVGGTDVDGIYRVDRAGGAAPVADIGAWSIAHPPATPFFVPSGVLYAMEPFRDGFLVTDGHHNRVLRVSLGGAVSEAVSLGNVVPTGLAVRGSSFYIAEAGPVPHLPQDGRIVAVTRRSQETVASGAPLLVDVEIGAGHTLYALAQGHFTPGHDEGSPADPGTGSLLRVGPDGTMCVVVSGLDRPTSLEIIGHDAFVMTLTGQLWQVDLGRCR
ncbi:MAG TPA: ScyD/ScyE family protein [Lapillicoccus sp.]|nr:ScyD/ScyE family protein [Lapillicoccus sp.]